ncbi:MAG TPA: ABC transporter permease [Alphaproteobacteria bacterium]|nr:ABC transporter permease [Alphaproteobacteria bacterium]
MRALRPILVAAGLVVLWQAAVLVTRVPAYILPSPLAVLQAGLANTPLLLMHATVTGGEILAGFLLGAALGSTTAIAMARFAMVRHWVLPVVVASQAVPVFALAPVLVLWLGYGPASKVAMAVLVIYFPVTAAFLDGLRRTDPGWLDLATVMGARAWAVMRWIRIPAALPALGSGLRMAAAIAPIGAVIGEWVGSSAGLGYLMLQANARLKVDLMFAALALLAAMGLILFFAVDWAVRRAVPWQAESTSSEGP